MNDLEKKKLLLKAIREAIANINLEDDFNISLDKDIINNIEEKVLVLGGKNEKMGRLFK